MWIFLLGSWAFCGDTSALYNETLQRKAVLSEAVHLRSKLSIESQVLESFQASLTPEMVQRFIKTFEMSSNGPKTKVDSDAIQSALRFYAPRFFGKPNPELSIKIKVPSQEQESLKPLLLEKISSVFSKRGWSVVQKPEASPGGSLGKFELIWEDQAGEDPEHSEKHSILKGILHIEGLPDIEEKREVLNGTEISDVLSRLLWEIHIAVGFQEEIRQFVKRSDTDQAFLIEVTGVEDFEVYVQMKAAIQSHLAGSLVEERSFKRGRIVFEVLTDLSRSKLNELLKQMPLPPISSQSLGISLK